jgi:hypothetical protein
VELVKAAGAEVADKDIEELQVPEGPWNGQAAWNLGHW